MSGTPGIDVSRWQGEIRWANVAAVGYRFAAIRATIGNYYTDPRFYINWDEAREAGLLITAYHVVAPERPADSQTDRLFDALDGRVSDLPLVLDVELSREMSSRTISACVRDCADLVEKEEGRKPVIYTARWFWDRNVVDAPEWAEYDLWVANYGVSTPSLPCSWEKWRLWQYSDHGQVPGIDAATDLNWFNGSPDDLLAYVDGEPAADEAAAEGMPLAGLKARVTAESVPVRSGPGMNYGTVGELREGETVQVVSVSGEDIWIQVEPGKWAPFRSRGERFMELE